MVVTLLPMVTLVRLPQPENAAYPMVVTLLGMVMVVKLPQPENAKYPMVVTLSGIVNAGQTAAAAERLAPDGGDAVGEW